MHPVSCTNTNHDVTDLVNERMVKNTKTLISSEGNIPFLRNKNFFKGYLSYKMITSQNVPSEVSQNVLSETQVKNFFVS